ncbi:DNA repair protein RecO [Lentisphaerota bacterium WC36G]|nr:DNA repair protein RecO [Lentisphaerae bacterium WC36]
MLTDNNEQASANCVILSRHDYGDDSLIFNAFSADYGKLDFIKKGAKKVNKKRHSSTIDLFNVYEVSFKLRDEGLIANASFELIDTFQGVAKNYRAFEFCSQIAKFISLNTDIYIPLPGTFNCFTNILNYLQNVIETQSLPIEIIENQLIIALNATFKLTFLYENGLLPDYLDTNEEKSDKKYRQLLEVIQAGENGFIKFPKIKTSGWKQLNSWSENLCNYNNLKSVTA